MSKKTELEVTPFTTDQVMQYEYLKSSIREAESKTEQNLFTIVSAIGVIAEKKLFVIDGYKSITKYAMDNYGYKKSNISRMIGVYKYFMDEAYYLEYIGGRFSVHQLAALLPLPADVARQMIVDGTVGEDFSVRDINATVKEWKKTNGMLPMDENKTEPETEQESESEINPESDLTYKDYVERAKESLQKALSIVSEEDTDAIVILSNIMSQLDEI